MTKKVVTSQQELGQPVRAAWTDSRSSAIWLKGDYRLRPGGRHRARSRPHVPPDRRGGSAAGLLGLGLLVRRRALGPLLYFAISLIALAYVDPPGVSVGRREGAGDRVAGGAAARGVRAGRAGGRSGARQRRPVAARPRDGYRVQRDGLPRGQPGPDGATRRAVRTRASCTVGGPAALHRVRGVREALPARRATRSARREGFGVPGLSPSNSGGSPPRFGFGTPADRLRPRDLHALPHARGPPLAAGRAAAGRLSARLERAATTRSGVAEKTRVRKQCRYRDLPHPPAPAFTGSPSGGRRTLCSSARRRPRSPASPRRRAPCRPDGR